MSTVRIRDKQTNNILTIIFKLTDKYFVNKLRV